MRLLISFLLPAVLLLGCTGSRDELDRAMDLRVSLLSGECSFEAQITADYGEQIHSFSMACRSDSAGDLAFTVTEPESICGITGRVSREGGMLTYDATALTFPLLADGQLSPVSAPWILMKTLRGGYMTAACMDGQLLRLTVDDSYEENALKLDIWLDESDTPVRADILYDGRRILSVCVSNFQIQ